MFVTCIRSDSESFFSRKIVASGAVSLPRTSSRVYRANTPGINGIYRYQAPETLCRPLLPTWRHLGRSLPGHWRMRSKAAIALASPTPTWSRASESGWNGGVSGRHGSTGSSLGESVI